MSRRLKGAETGATLRGREPKSDAATDMLDALKRIRLCLSLFGEWDDGCYYYQGKSATELEGPIAHIEAAIAKATRAGVAPE